MKTKTTLLQKCGGKEEKEDYSTTVRHTNTAHAVFRLSFMLCFCSRVVFLCVHPCLASTGIVKKQNDSQSLLLMNEEYWLRFVE